MNRNANMASMIPLIEGRIWDQWASIPLSPDSKEVGSEILVESGEVNQSASLVNNCSFRQSMSRDYEFDP